MALNRPPRKMNVQQQNAWTESSLRNGAIYWRRHGVPAALALTGENQGVQWHRSIILSLDIDFPGMPTLFGMLLSQDQRFIAFEVDAADGEVLLERWEDITHEQNFSQHNKGTGVGFGALALKVHSELNTQSCLPNGR